MVTPNERETDAIPSEMLQTLRETLVPVVLQSRSEDPGVTASPDPPVAGRRSRIVGVDVARGVALIGMMATHVFSADRGDERDPPPCGGGRVDVPRAASITPEYQNVHQAPGLDRAAHSIRQAAAHRPRGPSTTCGATDVLDALIAVGSRRMRRPPRPSGRILSVPGTVPTAAAQGVLELLTGLLEAAPDLFGAALGLESPVTAHLACGALHPPPQLLGPVAELVREAHFNHPPAEGARTHRGPSVPGRIPSRRPPSGSADGAGREDESYSTVR